MNGTKGWLGVFAKDTFPKKKLKKGECYIMNLENSNQPGSHWVAIYEDLYIDPYGVPAPKQLAKWIRMYNSAQYQELGSVECGMFCVYFLKQLISGKPIYDVLYGELNPWPCDHNERVVKKYFLSL